MRLCARAAGPVKSKSKSKSKGKGKSKNKAAAAAADAAATTAGVSPRPARRSSPLSFAPRTHKQRADEQNSTIVLLGAF